jgi:hypothetical protein
MENITRGERIRAFVLEGKTKKGWQRIFKGYCIGHKFIHRFSDMEVDAVRLIVLESKGATDVLNLAVFHVSDE